MFNSARIKLTLWYLLIIAIITLLFSLVIYRSLTEEIDRVIRVQRYMIEHPGQVQRLQGRIPVALSEPRIVTDLQLLEESVARIRLTIALIDLGILATSALVAYFLAGRTLRPIEEMVEEQKMFVADASHELRTPLSALRSEIEVGLRDKKLSISEARKLLKSNLEEVDKLQFLSDDLLDLSKYQDQSIKLNFERLTSNEIFKGAESRVLSLAKNKDIKLKIGQNKVVFDGNRKSLVELIVILMDNAIKFSPNESEVNVETNEVGNNVQILVRDQGVGIGEKDLPFIFNRFYQTDKSRTKEHTGFGLGLAIAKKIVDMHKGEIGVNSKIGEGSTFTIKLPKEQKNGFMKFSAIS